VSGDLGRLLALLDRDSGERIALCSRANGRFVSALTTVGEARALADRLADRDCWYGLQPLHARVASGRGTVSDVVGLRELAADLDIKPGGMPSVESALAVITDVADAVGTNPVAVVNTGGGFQPHWAIERGAGTDWADERDPAHGAAVALSRRFGRLVAGFAELRGGAVDTVSDLARVLRAPGTTNTKYSPPVSTTFELRGGAPVAVGGWLEVFDEWGVPERGGDRDVLGAPISAPSEWAHAARSCGYAFRMIDAWARDVPRKRHPWLVSQATCTAAAHRYGCLSEADHRRAVQTLTGRFATLVATTAPMRSPGHGEVADAVSWGVTRAAAKTDAGVAAELGGHTHIPKSDMFAGDDVVGADTDCGFWDAHEELRLIHDHARAALVSPWALLGTCLARTVAAVPPFWVLPAVIGSQASLNLFVALVGESGLGKGAAESVAVDMCDVGRVHTASPGSGEGLAHLYARRVNGEVERIADAVLMSAPEVDSLTALAQRRGATLLPELRKGWMGEALGFSYADPTKRLPIERHSYRLALVLGVQPGRAAPLLDDSDGGTPQRFLWLPTADPEVPDLPVATPTRGLKWEPKDLGIAIADRRGRREISIPDSVRSDVRNGRILALRGQGDPLDGHARLARMKVAAALTILTKRAAMTEDDWRLAGVVMAKSDATRRTVADHLHQNARRSNLARGHAEAERAVYVADTMRERVVERVRRALLRTLTRRGGGWVTRRELTHTLPSRDRECFTEALDGLFDSGLIEVDRSGGRPRYRVIGPAP
jgi:hypothetical protein